MLSDNELKQEENIATEVLHDVKSRTRRWAVAFFSVLILWIVTIGMFARYLCQYVF